MMRALVAALTGALLASGPLRAQVPANLDFETAGSNTPAAGWQGGGDDYEITRDSVQPHSGRWSLRLARVGAAGQAAGMSQMVAPARLVGRRLRVSGYVRTEAVDGGYAGLWLGVMSGGNVLAADTLSARARGTTAWTRLEIELPVADSATIVAFGLGLTGPGRAWFDGVELAVLDSAGAAPVPLAVILARPAPERPERPEYASWVRTHARPIVSLTSDDFRDLRFLAKDLKGRRVVQLGEFSHGVGQFMTLKGRLIKYLHEELGYDVLAFESSLFECTTAHELPGTIDARRLMRECIAPIWQREETLPLLEYLLATRRTAHPLLLTGFDDQGWPIGGLRRGAFFAALITPVDPAYARRVRTTDSTWTARGMFGADSARVHRAAMVGFYDTLASFLERHAPVIARRGRVSRIRVQLAGRTARGMGLFVQQMSGVGGGKVSFNMRDSAMAANLDFVLDSLFPGKKVITWAHNGHVGKGGENPEFHAMGERVARRRGAEVYTIGLFMYAGSYRDTGTRDVVPVREMPPGSLEHILAQVDSVPAVFLDLAQQKPEPGNAWVFNATVSMESGTVPRDRYDGILLVRHVTPSHYMTP